MKNKKIKISILTFLLIIVIFLGVTFYLNTKITSEVPTFNKVNTYMQCN